MAKDNTDIENGFSESNEKKENKNRIPKLILLFIVVFVVVFCGIYFGFQIYNQYLTDREPTTVSTTAPTTAPKEEPKVENPIDFKTLQEQNSDIYAWIKIDDTTVDYPIVQSSVDDNFYLKHRSEDKAWSASGAIYTESVNKKNFSDSFTLIYGHNGYGDNMFTALHKFNKEEFFNSHPYFYIYTPERKLTYQVISAFKYDDRHIMNSFNFADTKEVTEFQEFLQNPESALKNVRTDLDINIDSSSKIVILSTCITNQKTNRYLVCGVLVKDEKTY